MKAAGSFLFLIVIALSSCTHRETAIEILQKAVNSIDTIETIYYKQDMLRTDPGNMHDTISRFREMYFKRLVSDSVVGVKGHWYMYVNDKVHINYEDIYDGNKLIRKNNLDSTAMVYDLTEYPEFRRKQFWGHHTPYGMQYEFMYILENTDSYSLERLNDTMIEGRSCFQIAVRLENRMTMPGFATTIEEKDGNISTTTYVIDKQTCYPIRMKGESYSVKNPEQKIFIDQKYDDIRFNCIIDECAQFDTSDESIEGYEKSLIKP